MLLGPIGGNKTVSTALEDPSPRNGKTVTKEFPTGRRAPRETISAGMERNGDGQGGFWKEGTLELGLDSEKDWGEGISRRETRRYQSLGRKELLPCPSVVLKV